MYFSLFHMLFAASAVVQQQIPAGFYPSFTRFVDVFYFIKEYTQRQQTKAGQEQKAVHSCLSLIYVVQRHLSKKNMTSLLPSLKYTDSTFQPVIVTKATAMKNVMLQTNLTFHRQNICSVSVVHCIVKEQWKQNLSITSPS